MSSSTENILGRALLRQIGEVIFAILTILLVGVIMAFLWALIGSILSITIVGIPLGKKCFGISGFALSTSKKTITYTDEHRIANLVWLPFGIVTFVITFILTALVSPLALFLPNTRKYYKLWKACFKPFSTNIEEKE
ncbi:MAG: YccF domain-containing protein [Clostridia bacterium]|nr:YccF domain-containing protein [Clostridia bacterium]